MIPSNIQYQIDQYVTNRVPPGGCVRAILENNLMESFSHADENTQSCMHDIVQYLYNMVPMHAYGSVQRVVDWLNYEDIQKSPNEIDEDEADYEHNRQLESGG